MASITTRNDRFCVIYPYVDDKGNRRQKWETFQTLQEAKARKAEIEYSQQLGTFTIPNCTTVSELLSVWKNQMVYICIHREHGAYFALY